MDPKKEHEQQKEKLEKKISDLETKIGAQDSRLNHLQSSGFQIANFYFVFQGVILTAIANGSSAIRHKDRWLLGILSLFAAILNLVSLLVIGRKYKRILAEREKSWFHCSKMQGDLARLEAKTRSLSFNKEEAESKGFVDSFAKSARTFCLRLCMALFVTVSIIMIVACWTIGRRADPECKQYPSYGNDKCFRVCNEGKCVSICNEF